MCGENVPVNIPWAIVVGSPPRVRGKQRKIVHQSLSERITPACAGKTAAVTEDDIIGGDHPRVCGENRRK